MKPRPAPAPRLLPALLLLGAACAPALPTPVGPEPEPPAAEVLIDPLLLLAERTDTGIEVVEVDAGELLARAQTDLEGRRWEAAAETYAEVAVRFAGTDAEAEALYRLGVALEWDDRLPEALDAFRRRLALEPDPAAPPAAAAVPALIHAGLLEEALGLFPEAERSFERLLRHPGLDPGDRRAARVRLAAVRLAQGRVSEPRLDLRQVLDEVEAAVRDGTPIHPGPAAEAYVRLGRLEAADLRDLRIDSTDPVRAQAQVQAIADAFARAFGRFAPALRTGVGPWAVAAGYEIGRLYLDVHAAFQASPVPQDLDPDARAAYEALLRARTRILLANAREAWEDNLVRAERFGVRGEWVDATAAGLDEVADILSVRQAQRSVMDEEAEAYLREMGEEDPWEALLERLGGTDEEPQRTP